MAFLLPLDGFLEKQSLPTARISMKNILLALFGLASLGCADEQRGFPIDLQAPYVVASRERLTQLIKALETKEKVELLLGPSAEKTENGFFVYYVLPLSDLDFFRGCVYYAKVKYVDGKAKDIECETEELDPSVEIGPGLKYRGGISKVIEVRAKKDERLEEEAMKNLYGPNYKKPVEESKK